MSCINFGIDLFKMFVFSAIEQPIVLDVAALFGNIDDHRDDGDDVNDDNGTYITFIWTNHSSQFHILSIWYPITHKMYRLRSS